MNKFFYDMLVFFELIPINIFLNQTENELFNSCWFPNDYENIEEEFRIYDYSSMNK